MDMFGAEWFASDWLAAWNARDLDRVLGHCSEDLAVSLVPRYGAMTPAAQGKSAVRQVWAACTAAQSELPLDSIAAYPGDSSLVMVYRTQGGVVRADYLRLDAGGKVCEVRAHGRTPLIPAGDVP
jgi:hypothetical protein